jgi:hypothetical protein
MTATVSSRVYRAQRTYRRLSQWLRDRPSQSPSQIDAAQKLSNSRTPPKSRTKGIVVAGPKVSTTDAIGGFVLEDLTPGSYVIRLLETGLSHRDLTFVEAKAGRMEGRTSSSVGNLVRISTIYEYELLLLINHS